VLRRGEAIRIMTGAPMPAGADAVVMVEETERLGDDRVRINAGVEAGAAVRRAGDDVQPGDLLFEAGTVVTPAIVGVLASVNARTVSVHPRVRVAVLSTGDELVEDGRPLRPGEIRESNRRMLAGPPARDRVRGGRHGHRPRRRGGARGRAAPGGRRRATRS
jgi:molybdopterin molybdotransferase